ncbi:MAG: hypothetical protein HYZ53_26825 [Planctomycetes bacterium]|nr:hypothetical protein [Planctomycetota bacterium]
MLDDVVAMGGAGAAATGPDGGSDPAVACDPARWFLCALLPQAFAWILIAYLSGCSLDESLAQMGWQLPPATKWLLVVSEPAWVSAIGGAALAMGMVLCAVRGGTRGRAAAVEALGLVLTAGTVFCLWAGSIAFTLLLMRMDGGSLLHRKRWFLVLLALCVPLWSLIRSGCARARILCVAAFAHPLLLALALDLGFQADILDHVEAMHGPLPWDLRFIFVSTGGSMILIFTIVALVLALLIRARPFSYESWGPWFVLVVFTLTSIAVSRKLGYWCQV